ncbi:MAG: PBP1A family penicillin-binding protein [Pseudomonadota bacterium]
MLDPFDPEEAKKPIGFRLLELDSWIDSGLYDFFQRVKRWYVAFSTFMHRFRTTGWKRGGVEVLSEGATWGTVGFVIVLMFAMPAFEETTDDWLRSADYSVTFYDRYGNLLGKRGILRNDSVPLEEIPDVMIKAALATEDRRFFTHFGIDFIGTARAIVENLRAGGVVQGGSSITQQLAKNLFLTSERTLERKIKEAYLALWLEARLSKQEILKLYLERAYMGGGAFGVDAAAEFYFGKSVRDVTLAEAAMLAGLFKAPTRYAPHINLPAARARANEVLDNIVEAGFLTEGQVFAARANPATAISVDNVDSPDFFLDWAYDEVLRIVEGRDEQVLSVITTVDTTLQREAEDAIGSVLRQNGRQYRVSQASMVAMETDGAVRAIVGGRDYGESQFNRATRAVRQPGSSFKPFVYMAALENGYSPSSVVNDGPITIGGWSPQNYNRRFAGRVSLTNALVRSINTIPVRLAQAIGRDKIVDVTRRAGLTSDIAITRSLPLGAADLTVLEMTGGYATFANGGVEALPYGVLQINNSKGQPIYSRARDARAPKQVFDAGKTSELNAMMAQIVERGTGRRAILPNLGAAGKTGTTNGYRNAWFVGYTGKLVAGVWYGNDNYGSTRRVTGGSLPAMTWQRFMANAHEGLVVPDIPGVPGSGSGGSVISSGTEDGARLAAKRIRPMPAETRRLLGNLLGDFRRASAVESASLSGGDGNTSQTANAGTQRSSVDVAGIPSPEPAPPRN